jgi:hypothetical protein
VDGATPEDPAELIGWLEHLDAAAPALAEHPDHPDRFGWFYDLALAQCERADAAEHPRPAQDEAIAWFSRLLDELPDDDPDRDEVVARLALTYANRYLDWRYGGDVDGAPLSADAFVTQVNHLRVLNHDGPARWTLDTVVGLARLERYEQTRRADDLAIGIDKLDAVWSLPRGERLVEYAIGQLAFAHWDRAELNAWNRASLLSVVAVARRAMASTDTHADHARPRLAMAFAHHTLWSEFGERADLYAAIASWQAVAAYDSDWISHFALVELLTVRAELDQNVSDVDAAIATFDRLLNVDGRDQPVLGLALLLAVACRTRFTLTGDRSAPERALLVLDRVGALAAHDDERIEWLLQLLETAHVIARRDDERPHTDVPASVTRLLAVVELGHQLLAQATAADPTLRAKLAGGLVLRELFAAGAAIMVPDLERIDATIDIATSSDDVPEGWFSDVQILRDAVWNARAAAGQMSRVDVRLDSVLGVLHRASSAAERDSARAMLGLLGQTRASGTQSRDGQNEATTLMASSDDNDLILFASLLRTAASIRPDGTAIDGRDGLDLWNAIQSAPPSPMVDQLIRPLAAFMVRMLGGTDVPAVTDVLPAAMPGMDPQLRLLVEWTVLGAHYHEAIRQDSVDALRTCAAEVERFARQVRPDQLLARLVVAWLGGRCGLDTARRDPLDRTAAVAAVQWFREAVQVAGGEQHPMWAALAYGLAEALRLSGLDRPGSLSLGLSALAAQARVVMLQNDTEHALAAAMSGTENADTVATWALQDGDVATAVAALDAGRGLVLGAVSASRSVADRLDELGYHELAAEWRATAGRGRDELTGLPLAASTPPDQGRLSDALRAKVLAALDGTPSDRSGAAIVEQIQTCLRAVEACALVYLLPATAHHRGHAVVVPAVGRTTALDLPALALDVGGRLQGYVEAARFRDIEAMATTTGPTLPERLSEVGRWAGSMILADLIAHLGPHPSGAPAHVVLIPMGELALVPWHAAFLERDGRRRYAVEDLVFSYSPSARLFCAAVDLQTAPIDSALIVGDPDGSLRFAGQEARGIHRAFHPHGRYLGAGGPDAATPEAVLDWITNAGGGSSLLHFACHGWADSARPDQAGLVLAGGRLKARDIVEATRLAGLVVDQVYLAACHTNTIGGDHDEAFSLASVFLAAGARTVFGSLWAVPDEATSLLMFMVHHFLTVEHRPPARALHAAQRWMLDPHRRPPRSMPPDLAQFADRPALSDPVAWAAFTHLGR